MDDSPEMCIMMSKARMERSQKELGTTEGENNVELCGNSDLYYGRQLECSLTN